MRGFAVVLESTKDLKKAMRKKTQEKNKTQTVKHEKRDKTTNGTEKNNNSTHHHDIRAQQEN
jgi:hypothetical protein